MLRTLLNPLPLIVSLATLGGVALHDTKVDRLAVLGISGSAIVSTSGWQPNRDLDHTHVERISFNKLVGDHMPRIHPRYGENKKHAMQKYVPRGRHPFDNYTLPVI